jgi:hypothetical protein
LVIGGFLSIVWGQLFGGSLEQHRRSGRDFCFVGFLHLDFLFSFRILFLGGWIVPQRNRKSLAPENRQISGCRSAAPERG